MPKESLILDCIVKSKEVKIKFLVIEERNTPLLGFNTCKELNLVSRINVVMTNKSKDKDKFNIENKNVFGELG